MKGLSYSLLLPVGVFLNNSLQQYLKMGEIAFSLDFAEEKPQ